MSKRDMLFVQQHRPQARIDFNKKRRTWERFQIFVTCFPDSGDSVYGHGSTENMAWRVARNEVEKQLAIEEKVRAVRMPLDRWFDYAGPLVREGSLLERQAFFAGMEASWSFYNEAEHLSLLCHHELFRQWLAELKMEKERQNGRDN